MSHCNTVQSGSSQGDQLPLDDVVEVTSSALLTASAISLVQEPEQHPPSQEELEEQLRQQVDREHRGAKSNSDKLREEMDALTTADVERDIPLLQPQVDQQQLAELLKDQYQHLERVEKQLEAIKELHALMLPIQYELDHQQKGTSSQGGFPIPSNLAHIQILIENHESQLQTLRLSLDFEKFFTKEDIVAHQPNKVRQINLMGLQTKQLYNTQQAQRFAQRISQLYMERKKNKQPMDPNVIQLSHKVTYHLEQVEAIDAELKPMFEDMATYRKQFVESGLRKEIDVNENFLELMMKYNHEVDREQQQQK